MTAVMSNFGKVSVGVGKTLQVVDGQKYVTLQAEYDAYKISSQAAFDASMNELRESKDASIAAIQGDYDELNSQYSSLSSQYDVLDASYSALQSQYNAISKYEELFFSLISQTPQTLTIPYEVTSIGNHAFNDCSTLTSVTIPNSVTKIGYQAFYRCTSLSSVTIPGSLTNTGENAFQECSSLTSVSIANGVNVIDRFTFAGCNNLTTVSIPDSVTEIGVASFKECPKIVVELPSSITTIKANAYYGSGASSKQTTITIPANVKLIDSNAFRYMTRITSVIVLAINPPTIGFSVFFGQSYNRKIYVPDESVDAYKGATNWIDYASCIYPMSEFTE